MSANSVTNRIRRWPRWLFVIAVFPCLLPGCRTAQDNQIELLERELRTQEDYIYELEDYVVQYSERLRNIRCAQTVEIDSEPYLQKSIVNKSHRVEDSNAADSARSDSENRGELSDELPEPAAPQIEPDPIDGFDLDDFEPPPLQIEEQQGRTTRGTTDGLALMEEDLPEVLQASEERLQHEIPHPADFAEQSAEADQDSESEDPEPIQLATVEDLFEDQDVEEISHEEVATHEEEIADEIEVDGSIQESSQNSLVAEQFELPVRVALAQLFRNDEPGQPQSLLAVVEGYDRTDEAVPFTGEVSLMVLAPGKNKPRRVKRWDFTPEDVAAAWQSSHLGDGLHLELPLEETALPTSLLQLWVRVVDEQGEKLLARESFSSEQLAGLEVETGAKELTPESPTLIAENTEPSSETSPDADESESSQVERLAVKSSQGSKLNGSTGWRTSTQRTDSDVQGYDSTVKKTSGWTAQPNGGRYPHLNKGHVKTATNQGPIWTSGHVKQPVAKPAQKQPQPIAKQPSAGWSPYR